MGKLATVVVLTKKPSTSISGGSSPDSYDNENDSKWYLEIVQVVKPSEVVKM